MTAWVWVGLGGCIGAVGRYGVALALGAGAAGRFPLATFVANCVGCLLIGLVADVLARVPAPEALRLFLATGVLGGFTTFSAFGLETVGLLRRGEFGYALLYAGGSVLVGVTAVWVGMRLASAAVPT